MRLGNGALRLSERTSNSGIELSGFVKGGEFLHQLKIAAFERGLFSVELGSAFKLNFTTYFGE
jgi:hypothetical protein